MTRVKICGITEFEDARDAVLLGANAIGLNFYPHSPRYIEPSRAANNSGVSPPIGSPLAGLPSGPGRPKPRPFRRIG